MPRYHFDIVENDSVIADDEGIDLSDMDAVRTEAIKGAREIMADEVRFSGKIENRTMQVRDENGKKILILPFGSAIVSPKLIWTI